MRGIGTSLLVFVVGTLLVSGFFVITEECSPEEFISVAQDTLDDWSDSPVPATPITEGAVLGRATVLDTQYRQVTLAARNCTAATKIWSEALREQIGKFGIDEDAGFTISYKSAIQEFLDESGGDTNEAWERLDWVDGVIKKIERACL